MAFTVFLHLCFGMETVIEFGLKRNFARFNEVKYLAVLPFGIAAVLSDILIAVTLCLLLHNNRSEFRDTNSLIDRLVVFAINRCILTSLVALAEIGIFVAMPASLYVFGIDFIIGKLYANSFLATLNSRHSLQNIKSHTQASTSEAVSTSFQLGSAVNASPAEVALEMGESGGLDMTVGAEYKFNSKNSGMSMHPLGKSI